MNDMERKFEEIDVLMKRLTLQMSELRKLIKNSGE